MRALVLAAGIGSRLADITSTVPKPMIRIGGRPILESNVRLLVRYGFDDIVINTHHLAETIVGHFGDGTALRAKIQYSSEPRLLGTAGSLGPLKSFFSRETFAVVYGDNLSTCNLEAMLRRHTSNRAAVTLALWEREDVTASGIVDFDSQNRITRFLEKPKLDEVFSHWVSAGVLICEPKVLDLIEDGAEADFGRDIFPTLLRESGALVAYQMRPPEQLWWIDTMEDYERTLRMNE